MFRFRHAMFGFASTALAALLPAHAGSPATCHAATGPQRGALLELYTSEGCSSCPPADRWFAGVAAAADPAKLSLLAFHVDYWDSLGWPDRFGRGTFSERQRSRVQQAGSRAVYTPQVMFDERVGFPWDSSAALYALHAARLPSTVNLAVEARRKGEGLDVDLKAVPVARALPASALYLALYENGLSTQVKAGENGGVLLRHERVVRGLLGPFPLSGGAWGRSLHMAVPSDAHADRIGLTAFVQNAKGDTLQALTVPLAGCPR